MASLQGMLPVAERPPLTLRIYRRLTAMAEPVANMVLARRLKRGKEIAARLPERRGESIVARPDGPLVWLHVASVERDDYAMPRRLMQGRGRRVTLSDQDDQFAGVLELLAAELHLPAPDLPQPRPPDK